MTAATRTLDRTGILLVLLVCVSMGFNQVATKIALADIPPLIQAALRSAGATLVLGLVAQIREPRLYLRDGTGVPGLVVGLGFGVEFILLYLALQWTSASHAVLFLYTAPFFVALGLRAFVPEEKMTPFQWGGLVLSFVGVVCALWSSGRQPGFMFLGDLCCLLAAAIWGMTTLVVKATPLRAAPPIKVLLYQLVVSTLLIGFAAWQLGEAWPAQVSVNSLVAMSYQTFWAVCLGFSAWFWLLNRYRAGELSSFTFLTPLVGVFAGWLVLGERLEVSFIVALVLVTCGIILVNWPRKQRV